MSNRYINFKPGNNILKNNVVSGFLFKEDVNASQTQNSNSQILGDEEQKDIDGVWKDSIESTKKDISTSELRKAELSKILSINKDPLKRNFLSAQLKSKNDDITKKKTLLKKQEESLKKQEEEKNKPAEEHEEIKPILATANQSMSATLNMTSEMKTLRKKINEAIQDSMQAPVNPQPQATAPAPESKDFKVVFDKSTGKPWEILVSQRGVLINGTRFSFENLEIATSKKYNIVLDEGNGLVLDQVKLNKVLKYKHGIK